MAKFNRSALLAGASALALGAGLSTQANAFDTVNWDWNTWIHECVDLYVDIYVNPDPAVIDQIEKLQISIGDKQANAWVDSVVNDPATTYHTETLTSTTSGHFYGQIGLKGTIYTQEVKYSKVDFGYHGIKIEPKYVPNTDPFYAHGYVAGGFKGTTVTDIKVPDPVDALTELPLVQISAVALGNSESVTSNVSLALHEGQFSFDVGDPKTNGYTDQSWVSASNSNLALSANLLSDALNGTIAPADMTANAGIGFAQNVQLDVSAVSVANNHSITINADSPDNALLIADLTQFAYANNTANAYVGNYQISNYSNLGKLTAPLVNVSAVAAGNVSNITVNVNP